MGGGGGGGSLGRGGDRSEKNGAEGVLDDFEHYGLDIFSRGKKELSVDTPILFVI